MTTKVTIQTYPYPALVEQLDIQNNNPSGTWKNPIVVPENSEKEFTLHSGVQFRLTELPQAPTIIKQAQLTTPSSAQPSTAI